MPTKVTGRLAFVPDTNRPLDTAIADVKAGNVVHHGAVDDYLKEIDNYDATEN